MNRYNNFNFYAGEDLSRGDLLVIDAANSDSQHIAVKAYASSDDMLIGFVGSDAAAGDAVDFVKFEVGQVVHVIAGGTLTAGEQIGTLPLVAIDAATAATDVIRAVCVATNSAASDNA